MQVFLGGGRSRFVPTGKKNSEKKGGLRNDERNLIDEWLAQRSVTGRPVFVNDRKSMLSVNTSEVDYLLGIFNDDHLSYNLEKPDTEPDLSEMALVAMNMLNLNPNGYLLLIEAGRIDMAHHENRARIALDETKQLHHAVDYVINQADLSDTLVIVTSDHSHTMSIGGYPRRGNNILGLGDTSTEDGKPFFTLSYANGMSHYKHVHPNGTRINPKTMDFYRTDFQYPATVPLDMESHGGEDVAVFAVGPWSHLFTGTYEQNFIAEGIKYAMCISPGDKGRFCSSGSKISPNKVFTVASLCLVLFVLAFV
ncbi:hypothetical protein HA402_002238 [Bradysia odoriphaga]|nr:hypothetical protein HA402_002238 [Bradysia odoriphaga]